MPKKAVTKTVAKEEVQAVVNQTVAQAVTETNPKVTLESIPLSNEARVNFMTILNAYRLRNPVKFEAKREEFIRKMLAL